MSSNSRCVCLVNTALHHPFSTRYMICRKTWDFFEKNGIQVIKVIGNPSLEYISFDEKNNILSVPVVEHWENLPKKVFYSVRWAFENKYDRIYKVDDDFQIINENAALNMIQNENSAYFSVEICKPKKGDQTNQQTVRVSKNHPLRNKNFIYNSFYEYAQGGFQSLNRLAMEKAIENFALFQDEVFEDYRIGQILGSHNIFVKKIDNNFCQWRNLDKSIGSAENLI